MKSIFKNRDKFLQDLIDDAKEGKIGSNPNLLQTLLSLQESDPEFYTEKVIKSNLTTIIIAGTETSSVTMECAMSLLLTHSHVLRKLREEIDANVGHTHLITDSDLANLPYLQCVFNETLRLHPPAPLLLPHYSTEQCTIGGYTVPKGTILLANAWAVQRDPNNLWDDPLEFKPDRFMGTNFDKEGYKFLPFGVGRRACPGAALATRMVLLALGAFVQCFEWEKVAEQKIIEGDYKPLKAMCKPRDEVAHLLAQL